MITDAMQIESRFVLSICGPSGAGKSVLAKALVRLLGETVCTRVPTDYYILPAEGPRDAYLRLPIRYDWPLLARDLATPDGVVLSTPDFDFDCFTRRAERGGRPFRASRVMILDGIYPYPKADATIMLQTPTPIRNARIGARDRAWGTAVAARRGQLERSRALLEGQAFAYDLVLQGTNDPGANAAAISALIARKRDEMASGDRARRSIPETP